MQLATGRQVLIGMRTCSHTNMRAMNWLSICNIGLSLIKISICAMCTSTDQHWLSDARLPYIVIYFVSRKYPPAIASNSVPWCDLWPITLITSVNTGQLSLPVTYTELWVWLITASGVLVYKSIILTWYSAPIHLIKVPQYAWLKGPYLIALSHLSAPDYNKGVGVSTLLAL